MKLSYPTLTQQDILSTNTMDKHKQTNNYPSHENGLVWWQEKPKFFFMSDSDIKLENEAQQEIQILPDKNLRKEYI